MANILVKAPKLDIIQPEVVDVYFAKKVEENGKIAFEKIENAIIYDVLYIIVETKHLKEEHIINIRLHQYLKEYDSSSPFVVQQDEKDTEIIRAEVGNYKDKGGTNAQAIAKIGLFSADKKTQEKYNKFLRDDRDKKIHLFIEVDADGGGEMKCAVCYNLEKYYGNFEDDPNFWHRGEGEWFEITVDECQKMIVNNILDGIVQNTKIETNIISELHYGDIVEVEMVILHRTANDSVSSTLNSFKAKRNGTYYGTHFLVGTDGTIYQTANLNKYTNHSAGNNKKSIGIEVVGRSLDKNGNYSLGRKGENPVVAWDPLTEAQSNSVACLVKALLYNYNLNKFNLKPHEDLNPKTEGEGRTIYNAIIDKI